MQALVTNGARFEVELDSTRKLVNLSIRKRDVIEAEPSKIQLSNTLT